MKIFSENILKNLLTTAITSVIIDLQAGEEPRKKERRKHEVHEKILRRMDRMGRGGVRI